MPGVCLCHKEIDRFPSSSTAPKSEILGRKRVGLIGKRLILIICILIGLYVLINLALILFFFFGDVSSEEFM